MSKAELLAQIEAMTEEEAEEVKLIYAPAWGNKWGNMPHRFQPIST